MRLRWPLPLPASAQAGRLTLTAAIAFALFAAGCGGARNDAANDDDSSDGALRVFVSIVPQVEFVKRVGGDRVEVEVLVRPGESPVTYAPTAQQIARLSSVDAYFRIGVTFERALMPRLEEMLPGQTIVDTRAGIELRDIEAHDHGHSADHHEHPEARDPHIWLAPELIKIQARTIADSLERLDPDHASAYQANLDEFIADVEAADARIRELLAPHKGEAFYVFHPSYGYFADAYGLEQRAIEMGGQTPSPRQLQAVIAEAKEKGVQVIFVQPQFDRTSAEAIASAVGASVVTLDPLAQNVLDNLERMAREIAEALG